MRTPSLGLIVIGILLLVLGGITWYRFQYLSPYRYLDRSTPAEQNGLRLTKVDFHPGSKVLSHFMQVYIHLPPELQDLFYRWDANCEVSVRDSAGNSHPVYRSNFGFGTFYGDADYSILNKETLVVRLPLNHPPTIRYFDLHVRIRDSKAHWRIMLPRPIRAISEVEAVDEWFRHPEIEVRPGVDIVRKQTSPPTNELIIGLRGARVRTKKPITWQFALVDAVPEWVSATSKTGISPKDPIRGDFSVGISIDHSHDSKGVAGCVYSTRWQYRYFRVIGFVQKFASHDEVIDLAGAPIRVERVSLNQYGTSAQAGTKELYGYLAIPVKRVYKTPSGIEVAFLSQNEASFLPSQDKGTARLAFLIRIPNEVRHASPLYKKYGREPEIILGPPPNASLRRPSTTSSAADPQAEQWMVVMRIKPIRRGNQWVLPELRITFSHNLALSERIPVDKVVSVQERREDTKPR